MINFDELLVKLNGLKLIQKDIDWIECLPEDIWKEYFENNYESLKDDLYINKHRWYETSVSVIKIFDKYLGINHISNLYSENSSVDDCYFEINFFEMKEVITTTFIKK